MAESRHTGSITRWNDRTGKGQIRLGSSNTHVTYTKSDVTYGSVKVGDIVSFIKIKESRTGQFTARNVEKTQKSYSHNIANQNNPKRNSRKNMNQKPKGCLVFQTSWYNSTQFERIAAEYKSDYTSAPRFLFGDNNQDNHRRSSQSRQMFGGQAGVVGKYDRTIGYGIVTTFVRAPIPSVFAYKSKMDQQFKPLADHLRNGYDVIVPTPSSVDIKKNRSRYYDGNKQIIFHNLGTGIALLSMDHIKYIQTKIDELKQIAGKVEYNSYYNYDPKTKQLTRTRPYYRSPNDDLAIQQPPVHEKATSEAHQQLIDQREWQCDLCHVICQGHQTKCNQCRASKGATQRQNDNVDANNAEVTGLLQQALTLKTELKAKEDQNMGASFDLCEVNDSISSEQNITDGSVVPQPTEDDKSNTKSSSDSEDAKDEDDDRNTKAETIQTTNQSTQTEEETETKTNASSSWWPRSWTDTQNKSKQKQKRLQTDYDKCQKELKELNTHIATLRNKVTESTKQMNQLQRENNKYQSAMLDQNTKIEQHEDTIANQKKKLHDVKQQLRQQTRDTKAKNALLQTKNQALNQLQREIETTNSEHQSAMMKRKTQIKQHEVTIANKNTELQDSKEEVMELSTLLSGRDRNIATLKDKVAKQTKEMNQLQRENTKYQKAMLAQNTQIKQHEVTTATQHSEIQALQTHKSRLWLVLILSLICLPIFIGYSYQFHAQVKHLREQLVMDDQSCTIDQSYKIDQLNVMNTDLQQRATKNKQSIQMYKGQVATLDTKIVTLKDEIAQCEKDIQYKNSNYDDLTQEYQTCQNEAGKVKDLEEKIEEITRKMHDFEVDYEYCELEKAQMTEINKQLANRCK